MADQPKRVSGSARLVHELLAARGPMTLAELREHFPAWRSRKDSLDYEVRQLRRVGAVRMHSKVHVAGRKPRYVWAAVDGVRVEAEPLRGPHLERALLELLADGPQTTAALAEVAGHLNTVRCQLQRMERRKLVERHQNIGVRIMWRLADAQDGRARERLTTVAGPSGRRLQRADAEVECV